MLPQAYLTLNLLQQATLAPHSSAWYYFHGPYNYDATLIGLVGYFVLIHTKPNNHKYWEL